MKENNNAGELVNGEFQFVSLGKSLLNQKAWLLIIKFMREELEHALASQGVDSISCLEDTSSFHICKINNEENSKGDIIFHVTNSVIKDLKSHNVREIFEEIGTPIVTIGNSRIAFWVNMTIFPDKVDFAVTKEVAEHYSNWILDVKPDSFACSYSIPFFLFISCYIQDKHYIDTTFRDLQNFISSERYSTFSDFERRVLKPVKEDYDLAFEKGESDFTFTYKTKDKSPIGKKGSALINIELTNAAPKKRRETHINYNALQAMEKNNKYNKYIQLLEANKNLILTGAPGTGKTFMAKEIAKEFITNTIRWYRNFNNEYWEATFDYLVLKNILDTQILMVQFHPSYDYTDFVEGLKPVMNVDGSIGFKRSDGVFKNFCKNHYNRFVTRKKSYDSAENTNSFVSSMGDLYSECYDAVVKDIEHGFVFWQDFAEHIPESVISRYGNMSIEYKQYGDEDNCIVDGETSWVDYSEYSCQVFCLVMQSLDSILKAQFPSKEDIKKCLIEVWNKPTYAWSQSSENMWKIRNDNFNIKNSDLTYSIASIESITEFYYTLFYWIIDYARCHYERQYLPSVIIIDEINRGEINKIFGELFFSIDPGYRGEYDENGNDNKVQTQYQNLIPKEGDDNFDPQNADIFRKGFYVPKNVYIIGTMNDIDRSIESLDFATRRRFAFVEVTAEESYQNMIAESNDYDESEKVEIKKRMSALNKAILMPELKLGEAYQIGAAYFRKYLSYKHLGMEQAFKMLWNYHLKGLLFEYLRGNQNAKVYLDELEKAYNKKRETNDETYKDNG